MSTIKKSLSTAGYNLEEAYFFEKEQALIKKAREQSRPRLELIQGGANKSASANSESSSQSSGQPAEESSPNKTTYHSTHPSNRGAKKAA